MNVIHGSQGTYNPQGLLQPLEFDDCLNDSPAFRENLKNHEKEIEYCSSTIKSLQSEMKKLLASETSLSTTHKNFANNISGISFKPIGEQTEVEGEIECALRKFGELMEDIEDQRERFIQVADTSVMKRLDDFRKKDIGRCKDERKKFVNQTDKACLSLEKSLGLSVKKTKENIIEDFDTSFRDERENLFNSSLHYVDVLHEIQERKKFEFVEALLQFMFGWMTFYHQGYEAFKEFESYFQDLSLRLQDMRDTFKNEKEATDKLKEKVAKKMSMGSVLSAPDLRQGYLYSKEKLAVGFGHSWSKYFCEYSSKSKTLNMKLYNQTHGKIGNIDQINVASVIKKRPDAIDRRFCFEVIAVDGKGLILQALSAEDLTNWMEIMEGKEATYAEPMAAAKLRVPHEVGLLFVKNCIHALREKGLNEQGIYRVSGSQIKVLKLISTTFDDNDVNNALNPDHDSKTIASALKHYFREILPEPLMTFDLHEAFLDAMKTEDRNQKIINLKNVVGRLPKTNYEVLKLLIQHLNEVASYKDENLMQASNLGVVFGPTLMRPKSETVASIFSIKHQNIIIETLISEFDAIFEGGSMNQDYRTLTQARNSARLSRRPPKKNTPAPRPPSTQISLSSPENMTLVKQTQNLDLKVTNPFDSDSDSELGSPTGKNPFDSPGGQTIPSSKPPENQYANMPLQRISTSKPNSYTNSSKRVDSSPVAARWPPESTQPPQKPSKGNTINNSKGQVGIALFECVAELEDELSFSKDDEVTNLTSAQEDGWMMGSCHGHRGLVPANFLRLKNVSEI